jgi:nucleoside-diphosphate-sugar epimerase
MKVFVAGASGAIGRSLIPQLVAAGHDVTGTTRSEQRAEMIRAAGARAAICDALDADALRRAAVDAAPEVIVHELTALPTRLDPCDKRVYEATNRIRRDGTANLLAAAHAVGARRFICQSIAFACAPDPRPQVMAEDAPLFLTAPPPFGDGVRAIGRWSAPCLMRMASSGEPAARSGERQGEEPARMEAELAELATRISGGTPLT